MSMLLDRLRRRLRLVDRAIVAHLEERMRIVKVIARYKTHRNLPIYQPEREKKVLKVMSTLPLVDVPRNDLLDLFRRIMKIARQVEMQTVREEIIRRRSGPDMKSQVPFQKVLVVGMGVMGGSLVKALRSQCPGLQIFGVDIDPRTLEAAMGFVDESATSVEPFIERSDLIFLCIPIGEILRWLDTWGPAVKSGIVMDVGSVKSVIMKRASTVFGPRFIGGHPLCGSERSGFTASDPLMFFNRSFFLCGHERLNNREKKRIERMIQITGARPVWIDPDEHDRRMAYTSHLPQMIVTALAAFLAENPHIELFSIPAYSGTGLKSTLRLAGSSFSIWHDILKYNPYFKEIFSSCLRYFGTIPQPEMWEEGFLKANQLYRILYPEIQSDPSESLVAEDSNG